MKPPAAFLMAALLLPVALPAQEAAPTPAPEATPSAPPTAQAPAAAEYRVGGGDVLDVLVFGNADLSRAATVQTNGTLFLPLLGEVPVAGLTTSEIQRKLTTLLARDYLVDPQVEVKVKEYQSQFVFVVGEVNQPGRKPLRGHTRLLDAIIDAGGFTAQASGELTITRPDGFDDGSEALTVKLGSSPSTQDYVNVQLPLRNGDILTANRKQFITVDGEVNTPGRYVVEDELTLSGVISQAGGLTRFGSTNVKIARPNPTGDPEIIEININDIRNGKKPDIVLLPNDVVTVSRRLF